LEHYCCNTRAHQSAQEFIIQQKKHKTQLPDVTIQNEEEKQIIVMSGLQFCIGLEEHLPDTPSSSASQNPSINSQSTELAKLDDPNIFNKCSQIKQKNETLKENIYAQFQKKTSTSHHRLLTKIDGGKGRMTMAFLQA